MTDALLAEVEQTVDDYLTRSFDPARRRALAACHGWDPTFLDEVDGLGWFALALPESSGGVGLPLAATGAAMLALGRHLVPGPMLERLLLPPLLVRHLGEEAARGHGVPDALVALVDPGAHGSWSVDGDGVRTGPGGLVGSLSAVRFGREADLLLTVAEGADATAVHLLRPGSRGVAVDAAESADPTATLARVTVAGPAGPGTAPVLTGAAAARFTAELHAWARILAACELSGIASRLVADTVAFVQVRRQFGRPVGSFQAVKHTVADMYALASSLRNLCELALADAAAGDAEELSLLAAATKAYAADAAVRVGEGAIQMHGGAGFTTETDLHLYYKRALALRGWYGDHDELVHRIGDVLLDGSAPAEHRTAS